MVKVGSIWKDSKCQSYVVIDVVDIKGQRWVYYRLENVTSESVTKEFSCYEESFVNRFREYTNYKP